MKRRSSWMRPQEPWWSHPAFLLPILVSCGLISMMLVIRIMGVGE